MYEIVSNMENKKGLNERPHETRGAVHRQHFSGHIQDTFDDVDDKKNTQ